MKTPIKSFEIIKEMYEHFVEKYIDLEPKLMICEKEDFDNVENTLKDYELMKQTEVVVADKKISDDDLEKLKDQRIFIGGIEPLFDEETQNKLRALDVIKEKEVNVHNFKEILIKQEWAYEQYLDEENDPNTSGHQFAYKLLTKEEFDLLKEELL